MTDSSSWTELRYSATQTLPESDGVRDELDGITYWHVDAVRVSDDHTEEVVGQGAVAVFDLETDADVLTAASAYGGQVAQAAAGLLDAEGSLLPQYGDGAVDRIVLFLGVTIGMNARTRGLGLTSAEAIRERLGSPRSLVACYPDPPALDAQNPSFFDGVPEPVRQAWWDRGLQYVADNLWLLPPTAGRAAPVG